MTNNTIAKIALTAAVALAGVGFLVVSSRENSQHYQMVDELLASGDLAQWDGKEMKVHGWVEAGSIVEKTVNQETKRTFILQKGGKKIRVFSVGPKPDTFKDQSEVVATGRLIASNDMKAVADSLGVRIASDMPYVVDSTELMAKCPSKYEGAQANRNLDDSKFK
jgi:cytochrome c-type biogenesis protein CcmE